MSKVFCKVNKGTYSILGKMTLYYLKHNAWHINGDDFNGILMLVAVYLHHLYNFSSVSTISHFII